MQVDLRYPETVLVAHSAVESIWRSAHEEYRRTRAEWGGLLWGVIRRGPDGRVVPVVLQATKGLCRSGRTHCEILRESWPLGMRELPPGSGWLNLGDYHSHPGFGVFMSRDDDSSFWAWGHLPHWIGCVIDPLRGQVGLFVKRSPQEYRRVPGIWVPDDELNMALQVPDEVPS